MEAIQVLVAIVVAYTVFLFVPYAVGIWRLPLGRRPRTPTYDREGQVIALEENPGFQEELPDEKRAKTEGGD